MTLFRFFGDMIINKFDTNKTILVSMSSSFVGMLIYAQNGTTFISSIGAVLVGAGIANIYTMTMTLAASQPGSKEKNVSIVAFVSFTSFLISAPLIGFMGEYLGLEVALSVLAPTSLLPIIYLMNRYLREK
jgi:MFS family permease